MKCCNCNIEWTTRKDSTITHCPFCGESFFLEESASMADKLRGKVKTKEQIAEEIEIRREYVSQKWARAALNNVEQFCGFQSEKGTRSLQEHTIHLSPSEHDPSWEMLKDKVTCEMIRKLLHQALLDEGFLKVKTSLHKNKPITEYTITHYFLRVSVKW